MTKYRKNPGVDRMHLAPFGLLRDDQVVEGAFDEWVARGLLVVVEEVEPSELLPEAEVDPEPEIDIVVDDVSEPSTSEKQEAPPPPPKEEVHSRGGRGRRK